jgi:aspartate aminotransferase-like enzyme
VYFVYSRSQGLVLDLLLGLYGMFHFTEPKNNLLSQAVAVTLIGEEGLEGMAGAE